MRVFVYGGPRLPLGFRLGFGFDPGVLWNRIRTPGRSVEGSFIYVIRDTLGNSKVGVSQDPIRRLRELQTGHPERLELAWCAVTAGSGYAIENLVKRAGGLLRASGEWFRSTPQEVSAVIMQAAGMLREPIQPIAVRDVPLIIELAGSLPDEVEAVGPFAYRRPYLYSVMVMSACLWIALLFVFLR